MSRAEKGICFVICPIGDDGTEVRNRADEMLDFVIKPAACECGYEAVRSDRYGGPGLITTQIVQHLLDDPMVVVDLTDQNANVMFELAIRLMALKPFVLMHEVGGTVPFDVTGLRAVTVDSDSLRSADKCRRDLIEQIRFAEANPEKISTPVTSVRDRKSVEENEEVLNVTGRAIGMIMNQLEAIRSDVAKLLPPQPADAWGGLTPEQLNALSRLVTSHSPDSDGPRLQRSRFWRAAARAPRKADADERGEPSPGQ